MASGGATVRAGKWPIFTKTFSVEVARPLKKITRFFTEIFRLESGGENWTCITREAFTEGQVTTGFNLLLDPESHAILFDGGNASAECQSVTLRWLASI